MYYNQMVPTYRSRRFQSPRHITPSSQSSQLPTCAEKWLPMAAFEIIEMGESYAVFGVLATSDTCAERRLRSTSNAPKLNVNVGSFGMVLAQGARIRQALFILSALFYVECKVWGLQSHDFADCIHPKKATGDVHPVRVPIMLQHLFIT